ncbi:hypothetical protein BJX70DRAFT_396550 [Aspergillus crustosus]
MKKKGGDHRRNTKALCGRILTVLVGPEERRFSIHETLARKASPFFDKAMSGHHQAA